MQYKWIRHWIGKAVDNKFVEIQMKYKHEGSTILRMFDVILEGASKFDGMFQKSDGIAHDESSLLVEFMQFISFVDNEFINHAINVLIEYRLIDRDMFGFITVTNWDKYQGDLSTNRVQKHRKNKAREEDITGIVIAFNKITGKKYRASTSSYRAKINARFDDGYTHDEMIKVIKWKYEHWKNDSKNAEYITPDTLFRPGHFDRYLNQIPDGFSTEERFTVENHFGKRKEITQSEFDKAEPGFYTKV
jgi:uncharacterized phage protein (TIGR02220 family)